MTAMTESKRNSTCDGNIHCMEIKKEEKYCCYGLKKINRSLVRYFYKFGYQVGLRPAWFIIIPLIISCILSTGLFFIKYEEDPVILFVPFTAPFIKEQRIVESHFSVNYSYNYDPVRFTRHEGHSRVIVTARDDLSILRSVLWPEIMDLEAKIQNLTVVDKHGIELRYRDICSKFRGNCIKNHALNINEIVDQLENGSLAINYPLMVVPFIVPQLLGGAVINKSEGIVEDAKAIMLAYFVRIGSKEERQLAFEWERILLKFLHAVNYDYINVNFYTSRSLGDELKVKMDSCIPYIPLTGVIMVTACMMLLWMSDCVRSKPLIGLVGIISAVMSTGSAFGLLVYCGSTYTRLNVVALFLVLGIGVDDIFVAISAWQKTSLQDPVPKRLAQTYADAAVSVTITSLTNALAFAVGTSTPTVIVEAFCLYSCITIIFAYLWFVTFCGGFLAISGYMEEQGRHSLILVKVKQVPEGASALKKKFYSIFCYTARHDRNAAAKEENHTHVVSAFFRDKIGSLLCNSTFRVCVLFSLAIYLAGAIYGLTVLKEGLFRHRMSRDDSYLVDFTFLDNTYFRHMPYSVQTIITGNITYSDPETQKKIMELEKTFESVSYAGDPIYTQSWLRSFLRRLRRRRDWQKEIVDEESFVRVVREKFFANDDNPLMLDVEFNENYTKILASRIIYQAANVKDVYDDVIMMNTYRKVAEESEFDVTCFHLLFSLFDQHSMMKPLAIQSILIAIVVVVIVALLFIPDVRGSFAIAFSILSIAVGVIGYMAYWNINLDHVSAGSIFMCIGFSVDFSAHITYTYLSSKEKTSEAKIRESMHSLGLPILQGGFTTILSLISFILIPGYGYRTFFKTIFLVTIFAAYHSIILIPLFLAKLDDISLYFEKRKSKGENNGEPVIASLRKLTNGSLKYIPNEHTVSQDCKSPNNNENDTVICVGETKLEDISLKKHINEFTNGDLAKNERNLAAANGHLSKSELGSTNANEDLAKIERNNARNISSDPEKGIDNEAFTSDEIK